ncbi:MAG: dihydroorotase [Lachnospiraceae bacterium]|nr:dihydroorotase [Lachnospiraceae bacterium]
MLLIKNGLVIDPSQNLCEKRDIFVKNGRIDGIEDKISADIECETIDAAGCIVAPGLVDVHVHFRDPGFLYKEDIETGAKAAAKGGFTSVVLMANTKPVADNEDVITYVIEKGRQTDIKVYTCAAVTKGMQGKELTDMELMLACGAAGFTDDGIPITDEKLLETAFQETAALGVPISLHEENPSLITNNGINKGKASEYFGIGGSPREAEISLIKRDLEIALRTNAILNIQHISTKEGVECVRKAKQKAAQNGNDNIHAEATPHHFSLTEEAAIQYSTLAKMNPPLREEEDRLAIIEGLRDGTIDIIATDHAPHSKEEKEKPVTEAPSGIIGLETALSLGVTKLVGKQGFTHLQLLQCMSTNPAKLYELNAGTLAIGAPADIVIYHPEKTWTAGDYLSKASNSPFTGLKLQGVVQYTIVNGKVVYKA